MMNPASRRSLLLPLTTVLCSAFATAQVPDGYIAFGSFRGASGPYGIYFAHPRDTTAAPIPVTGLSSALAYATSGTSGASSLLRRPSDGALIVGERAPAGTSVDVHILRLQGAHVVKAQLFSCGTSVVAGEVPQCGLLPDERIVVAATDLYAGGPLAHFLSASYNWQGLGILDPKSGGFVPVVVNDWSLITGVINGLAVSRDGGTIYIGEYISNSWGALWSLPSAGGSLSLCSMLPFGASNVAIDLDETVLVTTLSGPDNLYRFDPSTLTTTAIVTSTGSLNAIAVESATGNYLMATANAGLPPRALVWSTPGGAPNLLLDPAVATISCLDTNPNPESYGQASGGTTNYRWVLGPNPGGLPIQGNSAFSITVAAGSPLSATGLFLFGFASLPPTSVLGLTLLIDLSVPIGFPLTMVAGTATFPLALPIDPTMFGDEIFAQALIVEPTSVLAASPGLSFTIL